MPCQRICGWGAQKGCSKPLLCAPCLNPIHNNTHSVRLKVCVKAQYPGFDSSHRWMLREEEKQDKCTSTILLQPILSCKYFHNRRFSEQNVTSSYLDYSRDFPSRYFFSFFSSSGGILASTTPFSNNFPISAAHLMKNLLLSLWILMQLASFIVHVLEETLNSWPLATLLCATSEHRDVHRAPGKSSVIQSADCLTYAVLILQAFPPFAHPSSSFLTLLHVYCILVEFRGSKLHRWGRTMGWQCAV